MFTIWVVHHATQNMGSVIYCELIKPIRCSIFQIWSLTVMGFRSMNTAHRLRIQKACVSDLGVPLMGSFLVHQNITNNCVSSNAEGV